MSYILGNCNNVKFSVQMKKRMYYNRKKCREKKRKSSKNGEICAGDLPKEAESDG